MDDDGGNSNWLGFADNAMRSSSFDVYMLEPITKKLLLEWVQWNNTMA